MRIMSEYSSLIGQVRVQPGGGAGQDLAGPQDGGGAEHPGDCTLSIIIIIIVIIMDIMSNK